MKLSFKKLFSNDRIVFVLSLLMAVVCWFVVALTVDTETNVVIEDVPVNLVSQSSVLNSLELHAIDADDITVDVQIRGERLVVGSVKKGDIRIIADLSRVSGPGTIEIPLTAVNNTNQDFEIITLSPATLTVKFDRLMTKSIPVTANISGLTVGDDYVVEAETISPATVTVSGPENEVAKVASCVVGVEVNDKLEKPTSFQLPIQLLDREGNPIVSEFITMSSDQAEVIIPIKKIEVLPLVVDFINIPTGFPMDELSYTLSNSTVTVAGIPEVLDRYREISLGYIDMKAFDPAENYTFNVALPTGFTNVDHLQTVEVVFDETNLTEGMFTINNFTIKNRPANYDVQVTTTRLTNVRILGDKSIVDSLTSDDIVAEIDLSDRTIQAGQFSVPIKIYMPTKGYVWAVGDYSAIINVKEL